MSVLFVLWTICLKLNNQDLHIICPNIVFLNIKRLAIFTISHFIIIKQAFINLISKFEYCTYNVKMLQCFDNNITPRLTVFLFISKMDIKFYLFFNFPIFFIYHMTARLGVI